MTGALSSFALEGQKKVQASFYYIKDEITNPFYRRDPLPGEQETNVETISHELEVTDLRDIEHLFSTDKNGFQIVKHPFPGYDLFNDNEKIRRDYYPQIEALVKEHTGASKIYLFDHTIRRRDPSVSVDHSSNRQPGLQVHIDQTPSAVTNRVRRHLGDEADELLKGRVRLINVWRPLFDNLTDHPLGVADFQSTRPEDLVPSKLIFRNYLGETYKVRFSPEHRWYFLSNQNSDETIFIKCYDSDKGRAQYTPHSAFIDPTSPKDARYRESIEVRALVFG
jgi:hypothetical protein